MNKYLLQISMPVLNDKNTETLTLKASLKFKELLQEISEKQDRSISYVVRELALRGLAQYRQDGLLKLTENEEKIIFSGQKTKNGVSEKPPKVNESQKPKSVRKSG